MLLPFGGKRPALDRSVRVAAGAVLVGDVRIGKHSSVWFNAVLRADENRIAVGENSNVQDNCTLHVTKGRGVAIGNGVSVGHSAVVHACAVGDDCIIGMGAILLTGAVVGKECIIGAGAVVKEGERIPDRSLAVGVPARVVRALTDAEVAGIRRNAADYVALARSAARKE